MAPLERSNDATLQLTADLGLRTERIAAAGERDAGRSAADTEAETTTDLPVGPILPGAARSGVPGLPRAGRYLVREHLGSGGMGTVFRAHDPGIGRDVAIKFLHSTLCEYDEARARFLREARAAGRLSHPNIVTVYDVGEIDGRPYMAMELLDGRPLASELARPMAVRDAVVVGLQLARTLDYAHARGIVHRDIKPGNIMRATGSQAIKVTDFGIAHMEPTAAEHATRAGAILGTPQYMSPEQARGEKPDGRSDLFSVGIVLYEMLAGRRPFLGDGLVAVAMSIVGDEPTPIGMLRPELPASLQRAVDRCLQKAPADRFQSGRELADALDRVLAELDQAGRERDQPRIVSLALRSVAAMVLVVATVMIAVAVFVAQRQYAVMMDQVVDSGAAVARFVAAQNAVSALAEDWTAVDVSVHAVMKTGDFHGIAVTDRAGIVRAAGDPTLVGQPYRPPPGKPLTEVPSCCALRYSPLGRPGGLMDAAAGVAVSRYDAGGTAVLGFQAPITFQGVRLGSVALGLAEEPLARVARLSIGLMGLLVVATLLAVAATTYLIVGWFTRPLEVLGSAMADIGRGRFDLRIGGRRGDEFGRLYAAFDRMAQSLQDREAGAAGDAPAASAPPDRAATAPTLAVPPPADAHPATAPASAGTRPGRPSRWRFAGRSRGAAATDGATPPTPTAADRETGVTSAS